MASNRRSPAEIEAESELLTAEQIKRYVTEDNPNLCPYCGTWDISGGQIEINGRTAQQGVTCNEDKCGREWIDLYTLSGIVQYNIEGDAV